MDCLEISTKHAMDKIWSLNNSIQENLKKFEEKILTFRLGGPDDDAEEGQWSEEAKMDELCWSTTIISYSPSSSTSPERSLNKINQSIF